MTIVDRRCNSMAKKQKAQTEMRAPFDDDEFLVSFFELVELRVIVAMYGSCRTLRRRIRSYAERVHLHRREEESPCYSILANRSRLAALERNRTLAAGPAHTLVTSRYGNAYAFGHGAHGQLGLGRTVSAVSTPRLIGFPRPCPWAPPVKIAQVATGRRHSVALCVLGNVYTWGANDHGQLGHGFPTNAASCEALFRRPRGTQHACLESESTRNASLNRHQDDSCRSSTPSFELYSWSSSTSSCSSPRRVNMALRNARVIEVCCGDQHTLVLSSDGRVRSCGAAGVAGCGGMTDAWVPTLLWRLAERGVDIVRIASAGLHSLAVSSEGDVFSWGFGDGGRLGHGDDEPRSEPTLIRGLCGERVVHVDCGADCSSAYALNPPRLFWWGNENVFGSCRRPSLCSSPEDSDPSLLALGGGKASGVFVTKRDGILHQLSKAADGSLSRRSLNLPAQCVAAACSDEHFVCCTHEGTVYTGGAGDNGGLGGGTRDNHCSPFTLSNLEDLC